jgi:hypothetical protein
MEATVHWKTKDEGGRSAPPLGEGTPPYATVVRFLEPADPWPPETAWSLVVQKKLAMDEYNWLADVHFLAENAPSNRLSSGQKFALYEGNRCVALGLVE